MLPALVKRKLAETSTKVGSLLAAGAAAWPSIKGEMPAVVQQLALTNPGAAKVVNAAVAIIGIALIIYREKSHE